MDTCIRMWGRSSTNVRVRSMRMCLPVWREWGIHGRSVALSAEKVHAHGDHNGKE